MLQKIGFNNGVPIDEDYFVKNIAGKHNEDIAAVLFPDDIGRGLKFCEEKEEYFRKLVKKKVEPIKGLYKLTKWVEYHGLKRATVTNSPRENAELMISTLGLTDFFHLVIIGGECDHAKPAPDPYIKAIEVLNVSKEHTFICEVPPIIVQEIFTQVFSYINMQLLNSNGEYVKSGLSELEMWCYQVKDEYAGSVWDEFKHIRQAVRRLGSWLYIRSTGYHTISPTIYALLTTCNL